MASKNSGNKGKTPSPPGSGDSRRVANVLKQISDKPELQTGSLQVDFDKLETSIKKQNMKDIPKNAATFIVNSVDNHGRSWLTAEQIQEFLKIADEKCLPEGFKNKLLKTATVEAGSAERPPVQEGTGSAPKNSNSSNTDSDQLPHPQSSDTKSMVPQRSGGSSMVPQRSGGSPELAHNSKTGKGGTHREDKHSSTLNDKDRLEKRDAEIKELEGENHHLAEQEKIQREKLDKAERMLKTALAENESLRKDLQDKQDFLGKQEQQIVELNSENSNLKHQLREITEEKEKALKKINKECQIALEKVFKDSSNKIADMKDKHESDLRALKGQLADVLKEREDLKTRFSKLAGSKLTDQNADIADLSDPNRAMKVSEKFSQLYDDEWTDAFEALKGKKVQARDAIQLLLRILQDCQTFCNSIKDAQMISLNNVLLHPSQDVSMFASEPRKNIGGLKENPRMSAKDEKVVRSVRRQIGVSETCLNEIKQVFILETKSWDKQGYDKKLLELCTSYLQKCAEVCWLMVLHDPPLYMKMDVKQGEKLDMNFYTVYSSSGEKIDYLVWPPLFNEYGGGLITKGVAEPQKVIKKK